ncbi:ribonuclease H-like domain-containing protein [Tanacetum coccineum]
MVTRAMDDISKPINRLSLHTTTTSPLLWSHVYALRDPNWQKAMLDEYNALITNGIDCDNTFSLVVKLATIRIVLSIDVSRSWPIHQLDVKNAFLHGHLSEIIYMHQSPWFRFAGYATRVGFQQIETESSLFIYHRGSDIAYLLLYVVDIILTASSSAFLHCVIASLHGEFAMMDLGSLTYFLVISAWRSSADTKSNLGADVDCINDPTLYRSLVGALQYLTFTRLDISYAVQQVCLYMHDPREPHLAALKRILCYVRDTIDYGLLFHVSSTSQLTAYTDANWVTMFRSSAEAEYRGVANVVVETAWVHNLLCELHTPMINATLVYCDNMVYVLTTPMPELLENDMVEAFRRRAK